MRMTWSAKLSSVSRSPSAHTTVEGPPQLGAAHQLATRASGLPSCLAPGRGLAQVVGLRPEGTLRVIHAEAMSIGLDRQRRAFPGPALAVTLRVRAERVDQVTRRVD